MTHTKQDTTVDPVCGMTVDPRTTELRSEYRGQLYYFCGAGCKKSFDAGPERYVHGERPGHQQHGHHH